MNRAFFRCCRLWFVLTAALLFSTLAGQDASLRIRTGQALDGRGGVLQNQVIRVDGEMISGLSTGGSSVDLDLSKFTVLPGLIDTHNHFAWHFDPDGKLHDASSEEESDAQSTLYALENAYLTLLSGVTTVQSLGSPEDRDVRDWIQRGALPGPRILTSLGPITARTGGPEEIRTTVRERARQGADLIKIFGSASIRVGGTPTLSQEQLDAACGEAKTLGLRTAVHAHGPESARRAVMAECTVIEHGALLDRQTLELMSSRGTYYDPHIGLIFQNYFDNEERYLGIGGYNAQGFDQMRQAVPKALAVFKMALKVPGLKIVFGTDAVAGAHGRNVEEIVYRVEEGGQSESDAIVSATYLAAQSVGLADSIGSIATGKKADLIAVEGNPLEDITALRRVVFVMKAGRVIRSP